MKYNKTRSKNEFDHFPQVLLPRKMCMCVFVCVCVCLCVHILVPVPCTCCGSVSAVKTRNSRIPDEPVLRIVSFPPSNFGKFELDSPF